MTLSGFSFQTQLLVERVKAVLDAADNNKTQDYNYRATKEAIARAIGGDPKAAEVTAKRNIVKHPFAP